MSNDVPNWRNARLDVGCGPYPREGWFSIDRDQYAGMMPRSELAERGLPLSGAGVARVDVLDGIPLGSEAFTGATAHHVLQCIRWGDLVPWLAEVRRVLQPGAWLRLSVPDFPGAYQAALDGDREWFPISDDIEPSIDGLLCVYITQCGATRSIFTGPWLVDLCRRAGFAHAHISRFGETAGPEWLTELDSREHESIVVECQK